MRITYLYRVSEIPCVPAPFRTSFGGSGQNGEGEQKADYRHRERRERVSIRIPSRSESVYTSSDESFSYFAPQVATVSLIHRVASDR